MKLGRDIDKVTVAPVTSSNGCHGCGRSNNKPSQCPIIPAKHHDCGKTRHVRSLERTQEATTLTREAYPSASCEKLWNWEEIDKVTVGPVTSSNGCHRCGRSDNKPSQCPSISAKPHDCGKTGHVRSLESTQKPPRLQGKPTRLHSVKNCEIGNSGLYWWAVTQCESRNRQTLESGFVVKWKPSDHGGTCRHSSRSVFGVTINLQ